MAYKQPRVPEFNEREGTVKYLKSLTAFLKDFTMAAWKADTQREKEIGSVSYPVTSVNGQTGDVALAASDVGALATNGTAADSAMLGGKAPEYYIQPRNLLDNSDFTNPVNQRGQMGYSGYGYTLDRWVMTSAGQVASNMGLNEDGSVYYIALSTHYSYYIQIIENPERYWGKTLTFAMECFKGPSDNSTEMILIANAQTVQGEAVLKKGLNVVTVTVPEGIKQIYVGVQNNSTNLVSAFYPTWAALHEGFYTAETLPPYVPKGYAVELAKCNAAPVDFGGGYGGGSLQAYPVGSIYMSVNSTSPASLFGGTWEQLKDRFLLGAGGSYAAGATGGEATHTLTVYEMPSHYHEVGVSTAGSHMLYYGDNAVNSTKDGWGVYVTNADTDDYNMCARAVGGGAAHNNMPPYLAVYMWKRVS